MLIIVFVSPVAFDGCSFLIAVGSSTRWLYFIVAWFALGLKLIA